jgi:hypothetical protein
MRRSSETWPGIGDRIAQRLQELGYPSVEAFTQQRHYSLGLFYKWIGEAVAPKRANLLRLARDLKVPLRWLLFGTATHIDGIPVDILAVNVPCDIQPETTKEKRRMFARGTSRLRPIAGGSSDDGTPPVSIAEAVSRLSDAVARWLRYLLCPPMPMTATV